MANKRRTLLQAFCLVGIFLGILLFVVGFGGTYIINVYNRVADTGEIVTADLNGFTISGSNKLTDIYATYQYIGENGIIYSGTVNTIEFKSVYEAEEYIKQGHTIAIKIDGKGESVVASYENRGFPYGYLIMGIIGIISIIALITVYIIVWVRHKRKRHI